MTEDVSEEGDRAAVSGAGGRRWASPHLPEKGSRFRIRVRTDHYRACLQAVCVYAGQGKLTATVEPEGEESRRH